MLSAVARAGTPIPSLDARTAGIALRAVLVYEQWGWARGPERLRELGERHQGASVLLDRVDSASLDDASVSELARGGIESGEVWSLGKLLGLSAGGLARMDGSFLEPSNAARPDVDEALFALACGRPEAVDLVRTHAGSPPPDVSRFVRAHELGVALDEEATRRRRNIDTLARTPIAERWPTWMREALRAGGAPGLAPCLRGVGAGELNRAAAKLRASLDMESKVYHFDFAEDPATPSYELCLAVPVHGGVGDDAAQRCAELLREAVCNRT